MPALQQYCLTIADVTVEVKTEIPHTVDPQFAPFLTEGIAPDVRLVFREVDQLPRISNQVIHYDNCYRVHPDGQGGYVRSFYDALRDDMPYAVVSCDTQGQEVRVDYLKKGEHCISQMHNSFFHLGFEAVLAQKQRVCFHAACVRTAKGGILFSGPSGIGKSTQADLWCKYRGAELINGDRPILSKTETGWLAWGSPYAGSSKCHINANSPVTAIVMLRQGKTCTLRRLKESDAFRAVWSGLTMYSWDREMVERVLDLASGLISAVPVFEFTCTPDLAAVDYMEGALQTEWSK